MEFESAEQMNRAIGRILSENSKKLGEVCEEAMIQDHEDCPNNLYSEAGMNWEHVEEFENMESWDKNSYLVFVEHIEKDHERAMENVDNLLSYEDWDESH